MREARHGGKGGGHSRPSTAATKWRPWRDEGASRRLTTASRRRGRGSRGREAAEGAAPTPEGGKGNL